jgi:hypothetical protein
MKFTFIGFHARLGACASSHKTSSEANNEAHESLRGYYDQSLNLNGSIRIVGENCQDVHLYYNKGRLVGVVAPELESGDVFAPTHAIARAGKT